MEAVATGASKRDAKHIASAKLLALLFPDCKGMVEVVKAAEAASKALKQSMKATNFAYTQRKKMKHCVDTSSSQDNKDKSDADDIICNTASAATASASTNLRRQIQRQTSQQQVDKSGSLEIERKMKNDSTTPLQAVKEEECEDYENQESVGQLCHKRLKLK